MIKASEISQHNVLTDVRDRLDEKGASPVGSDQVSIEDRFERVGSAGRTWRAAPRPKDRTAMGLL